MSRYILSVRLWLSFIFLTSSCQMAPPLQFATINTSVKTNQEHLNISEDAKHQLAAKGIQAVDVLINKDSSENGRLQTASEKDFSVTQTTVTGEELVEQLDNLGKSSIDVFDGYLRESSRIIHYIKKPGDELENRYNKLFMGQYLSSDWSLHLLSIPISQAFLKTYYQNQPTCQPQVQIYLENILLGTHKLKLSLKQMPSGKYYVPDFGGFAVTWRAKPRFKIHIPVNTEGQPKGGEKISRTSDYPFELKAIANPVYCDQALPASTKTEYSQSHTTIFRAFTAQNDYDYQRSTKLGSLDDDTILQNSDYLCPSEWATALKQMHREALYIYDQTRAIAGDAFETDSQNKFYNHFQVKSNQDDSKQSFWHPYYQNRMPLPKLENDRFATFKILASVSPSSGPYQSPSPYESPSSGPYQSPSSSPTPDVTPTPEGSETPEPTPTPEPSATPDPEPEPTPRPRKIGRSGKPRPDFDKPEIIPVEQLQQEFSLGSSNSTGKTSWVAHSSFFSFIDTIRQLETEYSGASVFEPLLQLKEEQLKQLDPEDSGAYNQTVQEIEQIESLEERMFILTSKASSIINHLDGLNSNACEPAQYQIPDGSDIKLDLTYATLAKDTAIYLYATIFRAPAFFDVDQIQVDFKGDLELLHQPEIDIINHDRDMAHFLIKIQPGSYRFTDQYWNKVGQGQNALKNLKVGLELPAGFTTQAGNLNPGTPVFSFYEGIPNLGRPEPLPLPEQSCQAINDAYLGVRHIIGVLKSESRQIQKMDFNTYLKGTQAVSGDDLVGFYQTIQAAQKTFSKHGKNCSQGYPIPGGEFMFWDYDQTPSEFQIQFLPALALSITPQALAYLAAGVSSVISYYYVQDYYAQHPEQSADARREFEDFQKRFSSATTAVNSIPTILQAFLISAQMSEQDNFRDRVLGGFGVDDISDLVIGDYNDGFHHLIQQVLGNLQADLIKSKTIMDRCYGQNANIPDWKKGGIHSGVNGIPLHPWLHAMMHTTDSRASIELFMGTLGRSLLPNDPNIELAENLLDDIAEACGIDLDQDPCQQVDDFLTHILGPYLQQHQVDFKDMVQQVLLKYLDKNKKLKNIKDFYKDGKVIPQWTRRFQGKRGEEVEVLDIGRILYNKSKNNSLGRGLDKEQREEMENLIKEEIKKRGGKDKVRPEYVSRAFKDKTEDIQKEGSKKTKITKSGLAEFCKHAHEFMDARTNSTGVLKTHTDIKNVGFKKFK